MLSINNISFSYTKNPFISQFSTTVSSGNVFAIVGESGCGKSTVLKLIYGLHDLNKGEIYWNSDKVTGPEFNLVPGMPYMKYLAQDFDLMPFTTVAENVGAFLSNFYKAEKEARIKELLEVVDMTDFSNVKVKSLSGGQQQRVAIARVLAKKPEVLLLDEPFSHIDNFRKNKLRRQLFKYIKKEEITCVMATHDVNDSLSFADEILIMKEGEKLVQNTPEFLYQNPPSYYVGSLFGNINKVFIHGEEKLVYPHQIVVVPENGVEVKVVESYFKGDYYLIEATVGAKSLFFKHTSALQVDSTCLVNILI